MALNIYPDPLPAHFNCVTTNLLLNPWVFQNKFVTFWSCSILEQKEPYQDSLTLDSSPKP